MFRVQDKTLQLMYISMLFVPFLWGVGSGDNASGIGVPLLSFDPADYCYVSYSGFTVACPALSLNSRLRLRIKCLSNGAHAEKGSFFSSRN